MARRPARRPDPSPAVRGSRRRAALLALVVVAVAVAPFLGSLDGELVWDDRQLIEEDLRLRDPEYAGRVFTEDFFRDVEEVYRYGYYRPLVSLSYYLTFARWGTAPLPYHVTNLALHALATLLLFAVGRRLWRASPWPAFAGALLFAVHPVHVEAVAWISGRTDLLCGVLVLAAWAALLRWLPPEAAGPSGTRRWLALAVAAGGAAMFAKEMAVFWPLALLAFAALRPPPVRRAWLGAGALGLLALVPYLVLRIGVAETISPPEQWRPEQLPAVVLTFFASFARYLGELVLPLDPEPYLQNPLVTSPLQPLVLVGAAAFSGLAWTAWRTRRSLPQVSFLLVAFLASFAPISNVVRIAAPRDMGAPIAERFLYLPSVFACLLAGWLAVEGVTRLRGAPARRVALAAGAAVLALAAGRTATAVELWGTERRLFDRMVEQAPTASLPHYLLGTRRCRDAEWAACIDLLRRSLELAPEDASTSGLLSNLAGAYAATGRLGEAEELLEQARSEIGRPVSNLDYNLALIQLARGEAGRARALLDRAIAANPLRGDARLRRARLALAAGELDTAAADLARFAELYPPTSESRLALALLRGRQGREDEAAALLRQAAGDPRNLEAQRLLGGWALSTGRWQEAADAFARVLAAAPDDAEARRGLATARARLTHSTAGAGSRPGASPR